MLYNYTDEHSLTISVTMTYSDVLTLKRAVEATRKAETGYPYELSRMSEKLTAIQKRVAERGSDYFSDQIEKLNKEAE